MLINKKEEFEKISFEILKDGKSKEKHQEFCSRMRSYHTNSKNQMEVFTKEGIRGDFLYYKRFDESDVAKELHPYRHKVFEIFFDDFLDETLIEEGENFRLAFKHIQSGLYFMFEGTIITQDIAYPVVLFTA